MPRFNFPIPGRRSKVKQPLSPHPLPSPGVGPGPGQQPTSLTKAQRILGTSDINVDGGTWDVWSNSGISISISEDTESVAADEGRISTKNTTTTNSNNRRRQQQKKKERDDGREEREGRDGAESGVISRALDRRLTALGAGGEAASGDETDDASSTRRRGSSSTIASYYDKSKQPLSISQQTSSSAMAMGVPAIRPGTAAEGRREGKKKPARLDLSHLLPRVVNRSSPTDPPGAGGGGGGGRNRASVVGHETQPSQPPPMRQRVDPKQRNSVADMIGSALRRETRAEDASSRDAKENSAAKAAQSQAQANALHSLYSHYEQQLLFRGVLSPSQAEAGAGAGDAARSALSPSSSRGYLSPETAVSSSTARPESGELSTPCGGASGTETPDTAVLTPQQQQQPPTATFGQMSSKALAAAGLDCSASVSSRHTRTSKASRRTTQSGFDMDLKQNSVLSLSSDSDDDFFDTPSKSSVSIPPESPGDPPTSELPPLPTGARSSLAPARRGDARAAKMTAGTPLAATKRGNGIEPKTARAAKPAQTLAPPTVNPRTSSLATATAAAPTTATVKQNPPRGSSRLSASSNLTINTLNSSIASILTAGHPAGLSVHTSAQQKSKPKSRAGSGREAKNIAMVPTRPSHRHQSSAASVDFYLRSQRNSSAPSLEPSPVEEEEEEQKRGHPASSAPRTSADNNNNASSSLLSSQPKPLPPTRTTTIITTTTTTTEDSPSPSSSRYMAVTRQEELLLAALRLKRARMRESILAEYESCAAESSSSSAHRTGPAAALGVVSSGRVSRSGGGSSSTASHSHHHHHHHRGRSSTSNASAVTAVAPPGGHRHKPSSSSLSSRAKRRPASPSSRHDRTASPLSPLTAAFAAAAAAKGSSTLDEFDELLSAADEEDDITAAFPLPGRTSPLPVDEDWLAPLERVESSRAYRRAAAQRQAQQQQQPRDAAAGLSPPSRQHSRRQLVPPPMHDQQQQQRGCSSRSRSRAESSSSPARQPQPQTTVTVTPETQLYMPMPRMKAVRISAVGGTAPGGVEMGWWGDDG